VLLAIGGVVLATWGHWPAWKTINPTTWMALLSLLQMFAQKVGLLTDVLTVTLGILVVSFGRRYGAGWRSHAQQIMIGLSTASLAQLSVQVIWQVIAKTAKPHSMAEYDRIVGLREKLFNGNSVVYLAVAIWWIVCLWIDEPGGHELAEVAVPVGAGEPSREASAAVEPPEDATE
jgi:membrane protein required for beta-lactamase induction